MTYCVTMTLLPKQWEHSDFHETRQMITHQESLRHYPVRASALDFKDAVNSRFDHSNVVFDLFIETLFWI